ncbi:MAG: FixH family protein [Chitinophagales bacterium]|jgi:hypothetical protein|nr:FixH family protein [Chitinophagales bacterium]
MNWGTKIYIFIATFLIVLISLVTWISTFDNDLLDENYYEKELQFQHIINARKAYDSLNHVKFLSHDDSLIYLHIPKTILPLDSMLVEFISMASSSEDFVQKMGRFSDSTLIIPRDSVVKSKNLVRVRYFHLGKMFFHQAYQ